MKRAELKTLLVTAVICAAGLASVLAAKPGPHADRPSGRTPDSATEIAVGPMRPHEVASSEIRRIRGHLLQVANALGSAPTHRLSDGQRARRAQALDWLRDYREGGRFPHNHTHPNGRVPVFVDAHGTPCAVGYLLLRAGAVDLVTDVVQGANNGYVHDLAADPRLPEWLDWLGLSVAEAARIQPTYGPGGPGLIITEDPDTYETATLVVSAASVLAAAGSFLTTPDRSGDEVLGLANVVFAAGHAGMALVGGLGDDHEGWAVAVNGGMALISPLAAVDRYRRRRLPSSAARAAALRARPRLTLPEVTWVGGSAGLQLRIVH